MSYLNLKILTSYLEYWLKTASRVMAHIASFLLAGMMLLTTCDVAGRYLAGKPIKGAYELVGLMFICVSTWGLAYCQIRKEHVRVSVFLEHLSEKSKMIFDNFSYFTGFVGVSIICWQVAMHAKKYFSQMDTGVTETLNLPLFPFLLILAAGTGMLALILLMDFLKSLKRDISPYAILMGLVLFGTAYCLLSGIIEISRIGFGLIGILLMLFLLLSGVHIGFTLIIVGFIGFAWVSGLNSSLANMALVSLESTNSFEFAVIPLFLLMSAFISNSGIGSQAYEAARAWVGHVRGGLAMATVGACGIFAACTGSSFAGAVAMGKVAYPEMKKLNYDTKLAIGTIAAGGTLGILIPPSMGFVLIGILTEVSIGKLFIAGIIPGLMEMGFYVGTIYFLCRFNPELGPKGPKTVFKYKVASLGLTWPVIILFLLIMGGIYSGVFTPTEAGGIGAFGSLLIGFMRRNLNRSDIMAALAETARTAGMIIIMVLGGFIFMRFMAITRIPYTASEFVAGLTLSKYLVLVIILIGYIVMGMIFDIFSMLILTVPLVFPIINTLGFDPIWYGVIMVKIAEIGCITPPFGINLFGLAATINAPLGTMYRAIIPFFIADIAHVLVLIAFPSLCTFLPGLM